MAVTGLTTCLWFDDQAKVAPSFYVATFPESKIISTSYYATDAQRPAGSVLTVEFEIFGLAFLALNAGPQFPHSPAISFQVFCDTQEKIDRIWEALISDGGEQGICGWCSDRFGVSWQVIPRRLTELLASPDAEVARRTTLRMIEMNKIVIADLGDE